MWQVGSSLPVRSWQRGWGGVGEWRQLHNHDGQERLYALFNAAAVLAFRSLLWLLSSQESCHAK